MIPWEMLDTSAVPGSPDVMTLQRRGDEYAIRVGNYELMNSRVHGSEDALAEVGCAHMKGGRGSVLVGGLGMGFTLAAVLRCGGPQTRAVVAELVPAVVEWNRGVLAHVAGRPLDDPRVEVVIGDVGEVIRRSKNAFDAILLDVDNGPEALTTEENHKLYGAAGLRATHAALRPGGVLAIWSSAGDPGFTRSLGRAGFEVDERPVRSRPGSKGPRYFIWLARRS